MQKVTSMTKPILPFMTAVAIIARGRDFDALSSSSDMWVAESGPMKEKIGVSMPIRQDRAVLPPGSVGRVELDMLAHG